MPSIYNPDHYMSVNFPGVTYAIDFIDDNLIPVGDFTSPTALELEDFYNTELAKGTYADWIGFTKNALQLNVVKRILLEQSTKSILINYVQTCLLIAAQEMTPEPIFILSAWQSLLVASATEGFVRTPEETIQWNEYAKQYQLGNAFLLVDE